MPHFAAIITSALAANNFTRETVSACYITFCHFTFLYFILNQIECFRGYYCWMAIFNIVLWNFSLVNLLFLGKEINCEAFLKHCSSFIFLVLKDTVNGACLPLLFAARR